MDHRELVRALKAHEPKAMDDLRIAFMPLLRYIISPILPDPRDREECLSDVLLRVWDTIGSYDPERCALNTWLTHLARNAALNRRRAIDRRREAGAPDESLPNSADGPEQAVIRSEISKALWTSVERLSAGDRALFLRKYYYRQSTAQIAAELGLTDRAVEGRLYRIRRRLQKELGGVYRG